MFCGAGSFPRHEEEDSSPRSPPTSRRKGENNPYAARGLDKFSMLLADLETRREKIMAKAGTQSVAFVRFVYSNSQDWVPIVVRRRGRPLPEPETGGGGGGGGGEDLKQREAPAAGQVGSEAPKKIPSPGPSGEEGGGGLLRRFRWESSYYWPSVVVLILACLAVFGRVFAICCTCAWWYMAPAAVDGGGGRRSSKKAHVTATRNWRPPAAGDDRAAASAAGKKAVVDGHATGKRA